MKKFKKEPLKPCPFCGCKAVICAPIEGIIGYVIRCSGNSCIEMKEEKDLFVLIKKWNNRITVSTGQRLMVGR